MLVRVVFAKCSLPPRRSASMSEDRAGFNVLRLVRLMNEAVERVQLDLAGKTVLTEAATGAYVVTPLLAAMASAERVFAVTRSTRHGTLEDVAHLTLGLADRLGVTSRIEIVTELTREIASRADIVTNSGHVRPIDARMVGWLKSGAAVSLMYEAWELRPADVDVEACRQRGIPVAGVNERHPAVDVFSYLGPLACKLLMDAGVAVFGSSILLLTDNPFGPFLVRGLGAAGAGLVSCRSVAEAPSDRHYDAVLVALQPRAGGASVLSGTDVSAIESRWPEAVVAQFFGDLDRESLQRVPLSCWPPWAPGPGHMGILLSDIGPEPIVRLQAGGLKVGELLAVPPSGDDPYAALVQRL